MTGQSYLNFDDGTFETPVDRSEWNRPEMHRAVVELRAPAQFLDDSQAIHGLIDAVVSEFKFTVIDYSETQFEPHGITMVAVIGESHVSIHTWPEDRYAHIEFLTCVPLPDERELNRRFPVGDEYIEEVRTDVE